MSSLPLPFILLALIGLSITLFGAVGLWRRKQEKKREAEFKVVARIKEEGQNEGEYVAAGA